MINNLYQSENKGKLFSPVNGSFFSMFLTFLYIVLIAMILGVVFADYSSYAHYLDTGEYMYDYPKTLDDILYRFSIYNEAYLFLIFYIIIPLSFTIIIHKSFVKGLSTLIILHILYIIFISYFIANSEVVGSIILGSIVLSPLIFIASALLILARGFFKIKYKWIQILILIILPIMVIFIPLILVFLEI